MSRTGGLRLDHLERGARDRHRGAVGHRGATLGPAVVKFERRGGATHRAGVGTRTEQRGRSAPRWSVFDLGGALLLNEDWICSPFVCFVFRADVGTGLPNVYVSRRPSHWDAAEGRLSDDGFSLDHPLIGTGKPCWDAIPLYCFWNSSGRHS